MLHQPPSKNSWPCIWNPWSKPGATSNRTKTPPTQLRGKTLPHGRPVVDVAPEPGAPTAAALRQAKRQRLRRRHRLLRLRGLDRTLIRSLVNDSGWVSRHENIFLVGPTGVGKSWLACALAQKTCRDGYLVLYTRAAALFRDLALARADGSQRNLLARLSRVDVLVVDDWAMAPMQESERRDFWEICEERYQTRSTILTSQVPVVQWHEQIGDATIADGILDRLVHNAHRMSLVATLQIQRKDIFSPVAPH